MNEEMIHIAAGFQYSVNLRYDLGRQDKLENFVPTRSALEFLLEIMKSTRASATDRARVLIGAYGKGKSHMVLMALSLLLKVDRTQFFHLLPKLHEDKELASEIDRYYASEGKILPVIISGSYTSIPQAFLSALEYTLNENQLLDIMPETNYQAAIRCIHRWKENYPETYRQFMLSLQDEPKHFLKRLADYDIDAYANFEQLYPQLTAGSMFNPFVGFDIAEIYSSVAHSLQARGYQGLYVVYDEFSKYLETNIQTASVSDTKMLQDFAEKCNRSGKEQLHLLLISHKEIANYIDKLPKQKTDGWRGVSERFHHMHMQDDYSQSYELIAAVTLNVKVVVSNCIKSFGIRMPACSSYPLLHQYTRPAYLDSDTQRHQYSSRGYPDHSSVPDAASWPPHRLHGAWLGCRGRGPAARGAGLA